MESGHSPAFGLLVAGILRRLPAARWAALALLGAAMLKLFLHDLARLEALYRIGAFIGAAIIAMAASFAYQRFLAGAAKPEPRASNSPRQKIVRSHSLLSPGCRAPKLTVTRGGAGLVLRLVTQARL